MTTNWHEAEFIGQKEETKGTNRFWLKVLSDNPVPYEAGQFFTFDLPTGEKRADRWRSYSIANRYDESKLIELCISYKKNGLASEFFFNEVNKGDKLKLKGPEGVFTLPQDLTKPIFMLCTGTGIVPFRAMLQEIEKKQLQVSNLHLIFGTRKEKDILFYEELQDFAHFIDGLKISICLSRESKLPKKKYKNITFFEGYIHPVYLKDNMAKDSNALFMICGWSKMIDEAVVHLIKDLGVDRRQIKMELFG